MQLPSITDDREHVGWNPVMPRPWWAYTQAKYCWWWQDVTRLMAVSGQHLRTGGKSGCGALNAVLHQEEAGQAPQPLMRPAPKVWGHLHAARRHQGRAASLSSTVLSQAAVLLEQ